MPSSHSPSSRLLPSALPLPSCSPQPMPLPHAIPRPVPNLMEKLDLAYPVTRANSPTIAVSSSSSQKVRRQRVPCMRPNYAASTAFIKTRGEVSLLGRKIHGLIASPSPPRVYLIFPPALHYSVVLSLCAEFLIAATPSPCPSSVPLQNLH